MPGNKIFLGVALDYADRAKAHARSQILKGSTQPENNALPYTRFDALDEGTDAVRKLEDERVADRLASNTLEDSSLVRFETTLDITSKYSIGSCHELAIHAFDFMLQMQPNINAEIFSLSGGDHEFLVLNREKDSIPGSPDTWGPNAVICDPWANHVYPASSYRTKLRAYVFDEEHKENLTAKFDPEKHRLKLSCYNTEYFQRIRTVDYLKENFSEQAGEIISTLREYKNQLLGEQERLKNKPQKESIIAHKIQAIDDTLHLLDERISDSMDVEYRLPSRQQNYNAAKAELMASLNTIKQTASQVMQFSKAEKDILYKHSNVLSKVGILGKTDTEVHLEEIADRANAQLAQSQKHGMRM
ncbi:Uncharacterised protein [Legionella beliardensis]|uniref:Uncharacterized protein n=1 Tax=Legionella beliardensis TaxID=91822 RepID=A0A378I6A1_9GAMM|nr:hypothetical protein [Legionella beliardensis]STX27994.1 Uncharacterised protein [Legionella beliardensis]